MSSTIKEIHLSVLDQSVYRQYEQNLIIFQFEDFSRADAPIQALQDGLSAALRKFPFLTGTLEQSDVSSGSLKASYHVQDRRDYGEIVLTTDMFSPAMLPSSAFCPLSLRYHPGLEHSYAEVVADAARGYALPIMCAQATFIPGGLVLSVYAHHSLIDGKGIDRLLEEWSRGVRQLNPQAQKPETVEGLAVDIVDTSVARLALDAMAQDSPADNNPDCPEIGTSVTKPYIKWLHPGRYLPKAKIISISEARILALRSKLQANTSARISTFTTIATLFWTQITRARGEDITSQGHATSTLGVVVDTRTRVSDPILKEATGNMSLSTTAMSPVSAMLQATPDLVFIAASIASALEIIDEAWIAQRIKRIASIPDPRTFRHAYTYVNGPDLFITDWQHLYVNWVWNIPGTNADGKAGAARKPHYLSEGGVRILPRRDDGERNFERLVCVEESEMERLVEGLGGMVARVADG